ncbi:uncharacterized protein LOC108817627 [Raphanus sativus]|uniref:Uncharacterized protein LOC108817627 n=1 Tax=Raphanus sativus TaxID=3726 RepID=A0A6J0KD37_RAPSA|nr:uncharacterized protein LOC108817627 [Raphanus sativus]
MLPLKLARSLLLHETLNLTHNSGDTNDGDDGDGGETSIREILSSSYKKKNQSKTRSRSNNNNSKTALLFFVPTRELIADTYRLASIARDLGMDLYPTPSLSHVIFSFPPRDSSVSPSPFSTSSRPSTWSSSSSLSWSLPNDAVMLSFPSLSASSLSHLRSFVSLSNGLFKLVFSSAADVDTPSSSSVSNWDCCSVSLVSRITNKRIGSMESFAQALASNGWTIYKTKANESTTTSHGGNAGSSSAYLFRKVYSGRVMMMTTRDGGNGGSCSRVRELRLPLLDFENAPLRILQYLMLMTDHLFFLA